MLIYSLIVSTGSRYTAPRGYMDTKRRPHYHAGKNPVLTIAPAFKSFIALSSKIVISRPDAARGTATVRLALARTRRYIRNKGGHIHEKVTVFTTKVSMFTTQVRILTTNFLMVATKCLVHTTKVDVVEKQEYARIRRDDQDRKQQGEGIGCHCVFTGLVMRQIAAVRLFTRSVHNSFGDHAGLFFLEAP